MHDLYAQVTNKIIEALERGTPPWVRPWSEITDAIPVNAQNRRPYRGVNFTLLSLDASVRGYNVNRWLTYRQARELGAQVREGEHGSPVVFWQLRRIAVTADSPLHDDAPGMPERVYPLLRAYTVFNVAQCDGIPTEYAAPSKAASMPEAKGEELLLMSGARFTQGGTRAYYQPATDEIHLPPMAAFPTAAGYYNVALHELSHWTSHASRCNHQLGQRFGDAAYAAEELIAEMGAAYLLAHCQA